MKFWLFQKDQTSGHRAAQDTNSQPTSTSDTHASGPDSYPPPKELDNNRLPQSSNSGPAPALSNPTVTVSPALDTPADPRSSYPSHRPQSPTRSSGSVSPSAPVAPGTDTVPDIPQSSPLDRVCADGDDDDIDLRIIDNTVAILGDDQIDSLARTLEQAGNSQLDRDLSSPGSSDSESEEKPPLPPRPGQSSDKNQSKPWYLPSFLVSRSRSHPPPKNQTCSSALNSDTQSKSPDPTTSDKTNHNNSQDAPDQPTAGPSTDPKMPSHRSHYYPEPVRSSHGPTHHGPPPSTSTRRSRRYSHGDYKENSRKVRCCFLCILGPPPLHVLTVSQGKEPVMDPLGYAPDYSYHDAVALVNSADPYLDKGELSDSKTKKKGLSKLSFDSSKLVKDFNLVVKDIGRGAPAAYGDLEKLIVTNNSHLESIFDRLPTRMQKASKVLAKSMVKNASKNKTSGKHDVPATTDKSLPGFMKILDTGMLLSLLSKLRLPAALPAAALTPTAMASLGAFVVLCSLWYCFKRGREIRLQDDETINDRMDRLSINSCDCPSCIDDDRRSVRSEPRVTYDRYGGPEPAYPPRELTDGHQRRSRHDDHVSRSGYGRPLEYDQRSYESGPSRTDGRHSRYHDDRTEYSTDHHGRDGHHTRDRYRDHERDRDHDRERRHRHKEHKSARSDRR